MALRIGPPRRSAGALHAVLALCVVGACCGVRNSLNDRAAAPGAGEGGEKSGGPQVEPAEVVGAADGAYFGPSGATWSAQEEKPLSWWNWLLALGGGTGAAIGESGSTKANQRLLQRMRTQDKAVMMLLLLAYLASLAFSARLAYRQSCNNSPVKYYADPRVSSATTDEEDLDSFLQAFNAPPQEAQLQVTGLTPLPHLPEYMLDAAEWWSNGRYRVAFSFGLDLTQWLKRDDGGEETEGETPATGMAPEDRERLRNYLANDANDLSYVSLHQEVEWKDWEELATNIKLQIRQSGFTGVVHVRKKPTEVVAIHKNKAWANFMHNRTTKVILVLSVFGWFLQQAYMFVRHRALDARCRYTVDVKIAEYWPLIADKIGPSGFNSGVTLPAPRRQQQQRRGERPSLY